MKDNSTTTIVRYTLKEVKNLPDDTDWKRVDSMTDDDIYLDALDDPDAQPTDAEFWFRKTDPPISDETVSIEVPKVLIPTIRKLIAEHVKEELTGHAV